MLSDTLSDPVFSRFADPAVETDRPFFAMINMMDTHQLISSMNRPAPVFLTDPNTHDAPADLPFNKFGYTRPAALLFNTSNSISGEYTIAPAIATSRNFDEDDIVGYVGDFNVSSISHTNGGIPGYLPEDIGIASILSKEYDLIKNVDYRLQKYIEKLKKLEIYDDTLIIVFGDHGSGTYKAKVLLQKQSLHTPMWIKYPKGVALSNSVEQRQGVDEKEYNVDPRLTSLTDIYPTILSVLGKPKENYMSGRAVGGKHEDTSLERDMVFGSLNRVGDRVYKTFVALNKDFMYQKTLLTKQTIDETADNEWGEEKYNTKDDAVADGLYENHFTFFGIAPLYRRMQRLMKQNADDSDYLKKYMGIIADGVMPPSEAFWNLKEDPNTNDNLLRDLTFTVSEGMDIMSWGNNVTNVTLQYSKEDSSYLTEEERDQLGTMRTGMAAWIKSQKWVKDTIDVTDRYAEENEMATAFWPNQIQPQTGSVSIGKGPIANTAAVLITTPGTVVRVASVTAFNRERCAQLPRDIRFGNKTLTLRHPGFEAEEYTLRSGAGETQRTMRGFVYSPDHNRSVVWTDQFGSAKCTLFVKEDGTFMELDCPLQYAAYVWDTRDSTWDSANQTWVGVDEDGTWTDDPVTVWDESTGKINMDSLVTYVIGPDRDQMYGNTSGTKVHQVALELGDNAPPSYWALPGFNVNTSSIPTVYPTKGILDPVAWYWKAATFRTNKAEDLDNKGSFEMTLVSICDSPSRVDTIDVAFASFSYECLPWTVATEVQLDVHETTHVFAQGVRKGYKDTTFVEHTFLPDHVHNILDVLTTKIVDNSHDSFLLSIVMFIVIAVFCLFIVSILISFCCCKKKESFIQTRGDLVHH
jgi:hypothetical protein